MKEQNNPLTPHLQIYRWQISSLLSITHRIVGVIICLWFIFLTFGESNYQIIKIFLQSFFGKFIAISLCWTFSFHILNEIRHLAWDLGYGFDLRISRITGIIVIIGSFVGASSIYLLSKNFI
jgi:succinate dehydrogenase / fumarate reductase cytochrome b subunit